MKLWPVHSVSFTTILSKEEALARLHAEIGGRTLFVNRAMPLSMSVDTTAGREDFLGERLPDGGTFTRNLNTSPGDLTARNGFAQMTRCKIEATSDGARVVARTHINALGGLALLMFVALMLAMTTLSLTSPLESVTILDKPATQTSVLWSAAIEIAVTIAGWCAACYFLSEDAKRTERILRAILERP